MLTGLSLVAFSWGQVVAGAGDISKASSHVWFLMMPVAQPQLWLLAGAWTFYVV